MIPARIAFFSLVTSVFSYFYRHFSGVDLRNIIYIAFCLFRGTFDLSSAFV